LSAWFISNTKTPFSYGNSYRGIMGILRMQKSPAFGGFNLTNVYAKFLAFKLQILAKVMKQIDHPMKDYLVRHFSYHEYRNGAKRTCPIFCSSGRLQSPDLIEDIAKAARLVRISCDQNFQMTCYTQDLLQKTLYISSSSFPTIELTSKLSTLYFYIKSALYDPHTLTESQKRWQNTYNFSLESVWKSIKKKTKCRPSIRSFMIRLWNNGLFLTHNCSACNCQIVQHRLEHFLFECSFNRKIFNIFNINTKLFFTNPSKARNFYTVIIVLFKVYHAHMKLFFENIPINTDVILSNIRDELFRYSTAFKK
jgi:hypothetical protein